MKMCSKVDQTATLSPQDNYFPEVLENCKEICYNVENAKAKWRKPDEEVRIMAVTKTVPPEKVNFAVAQGFKLLGENRVQEAEGKRAGWPAENKTPWHLIGHLQRNKARKALAIFSVIESVDSLDLARMLDRILAETNAVPYVIYLEVNMSGEASKSGMAPTDAERILDQIRDYCPHLSVEGLMTIGPNVDDADSVRRSFVNLRELRERLRSSAGLALPELSMGMSGDFEAAIEEGSTIVRVGTAIFGPRVYN